MAEKEYIEREEAKKVLAFDYAYAAAKLLDAVPTADVTEVRHGKWIKYKHSKFGNELKCSFCDYSYFTDNTEYNFCPNCGAKMDKE